jgi:hypothetical protein
MPIRGLTEQKRLPRLLKLHLGEPPTEGRNHPVKTDHFVIHDDEPLAELFHEVYGPEPKELRIIFPPASEPGKTEAECCANQYYYAFGSGTGRVCKGDGYKAEALLDADKMKATGGEVQLACWATSKSTHVEWRTIDCPGAGYEGKPPCPMFETKRCKRLMMLQFFLDGLPPDGICQIDTSSVNSIRNINDALNMVEKLTGGRISLIPMKLRVVPKDVAHDGKKVRVYVLQLQAERRMVELIDAIDKPRAQFLLPAPDDETPDLLYPESDDEAIPVEAEVLPLSPAPAPAAAPTVPTQAQQSEPSPVPTAAPVAAPAATGTTEAQGNGNAVDPATFKNAGQFLQAAHDVLDLHKTEVLDVLKVKRMEDVLDYAAAWRILQAAKAKAEGGE